MHGNDRNKTSGTSLHVLLIRSASHFVGYVLDDEPIDAIMRKFEELERFERELAEKTVEPTAMSEKDLEELFKRTSNYTVEAAVDPLQAVASVVMHVEDQSEDSEM
jgi:hypothetical protein